MTVTGEVRGSNRDAAPPPPVDTRPVEFWPTAAIRAALENDDLSVWQRIVVAAQQHLGRAFKAHGSLSDLRSRRPRSLVGWETSGRLSG